MSVSTHPDPPESDDLAQALAWAIVAAFGVWAGWGWLADGVNALSLLLAVVFGLFQVATNILAVKVRELAAREAWITMIAAAVAMVVTGLFTHESLTHAYAVTQEKGYASADPELMGWLLLAVPYLEPLFFWINRLLTEPPVERTRLVTQVGLLPALAVLLFGPQALAAQPAPPAVRAPTEPRPVTQTLPRATVTRLADPRRVEARLLLEQGKTPYSVHKATGVPLSTLKGWAKLAA